MLRNAIRKSAVCLLLATAILSPAKDLRAQQSSAKELTIERIYSQPSLSGRLTRGVQWTPDGKAVSFLEVTGTGAAAKTELAALDLDTGAKRVLATADVLDRALPPEKTAKQSQATGLGRRAVAQYEWAPGGGAILLVGAKALAWLDLKTQSAKVLLSGDAGVADVKISPDGKYVSFVRGHNLFAVEVAGGKEIALTTGGTEEIRKGELDWVYPEELDARTAYWWSPDSSRVAFLEMDESKVTKYPLVDFASFDGDTEEERYPVAGGPNPVVHVYTVGVAGGAPQLLDTGTEKEQYIARVDWLRDSKRVAIQRLNRAQTRLELLFADATTGKSSVVVSENDAYWINIADDLYFLKDGKRFLWSSEKNGGFRHLFLYDLSGKELAQVTKGEWVVTGLQFVDDARNLAYFEATEKTPLERHLYRIGLDGKGLERLTKEDGTHAVQFSADGGAYLDTFSSAGTPAQQWLRKTNGSKSLALNENKVPELAEYRFSPMEFLTIRSHDGADLHAWVIKPANFDPSKKYPAIVYTYGGPGVQVVTNSWGGATYLWHQMLAQKGFVIFALDNRGSTGRGHYFEEPIHLRLGAQEMSDQRDGVMWLKGQPWVDASRLGIWGWSYGGHMTLHAMFEDPEDFKAGFAGGPVTDWHYYDSIYTERYLGLLPENDESYQESSPIEKAEQLRGKLLIAHGTGDDNVHFANTLALIDKLITLGKYIEVLPFPGRGHGVSDAPARIVLMKRVTQFFLENLGGTAGAH